MVSKVHLAAIYRDAGRPAEARPLLEAMLTRARESYGAGSREETEIIIEIARLEVVERRWNEAEDHYRKAGEAATAFADSGHVLPRLRAELRELAELRR
jgi:hypothetical protein